MQEQSVGEQFNQSEFSLLCSHWWRMVAWFWCHGMDICTPLFLATLTITSARSAGGSISCYMNRRFCWTWSWRQLSQVPPRHLHINKCKKIKHAQWKNKARHQDLRHAHGISTKHAHGKRFLSDVQRTLAFFGRGTGVDFVTSPTQKIVLTLRAHLKL